MSAELFSTGTVHVAGRLKEACGVPCPKQYIDSYGMTAADTWGWGMVFLFKSVCFTKLRKNKNKYIKLSYSTRKKKFVSEKNKLFK